MLAYNENVLCYFVGVGLFFGFAFPLEVRMIIHDIVNSLITYDSMLSCNLHFQFSIHPSFRTNTQFEVELQDILTSWSVGHKRISKISCLLKQSSLIKPRSNENESWNISIKL
jgi:hypothetical protein